MSTAPTPMFAASPASPCQRCTNDGTADYSCKASEDGLLVFCDGPGPNENADGVFKALAGSCLFRFVPWADHIGEPIDRLNAVESADADTRPWIVLASDIKTAPIEWLWKDRFELGALNIIAGVQGVSKGVLTVAMAASVSRGTPWPNEPGFNRRASATIFMTGEDSPERTTVPRLEAAEADLDRVHFLKGWQCGDEQNSGFSMSKHLHILEQAISETAATLVIIDPISSYIGNTDVNKNDEVRAVLEPLNHLADRTGVAIVMVKHLSKSPKSIDALYRVSGASAWTEVPRTVHFVVKDKDGRIAFARRKANNARPTPNLAYSLMSVGDYPVIVWEGESDANVDEILSGGGRTAKATDQAAEWAKETLTAAGGNMASAELFAAAKAAGFGEKTLYKALRKIGATSFRPAGEKNPTWTWRLGEENGS